MRPKGDSTVERDRGAGSLPHHYRAVATATAMLLITCAVFGFQVERDPVQWTLKAETPASAVIAGERFKVRVIASIDQGWHVYSLDQPDGGPIPTRIVLAEGQPFKLVDEVEAPVARVEFDPFFNLETQLFEGEAVFLVPISVASGAPAGRQKLEIHVTFQTCNDEKCLAPKLVRLTTTIEIAPPVEPQSSRPPGPKEPGA
ncbi:MAG: hypothetical protein HY650_10080 [Acidobacteria bacterium]|nr:hypothetical protein [Acidobacteriota bacterium]